MDIHGKIFVRSLCDYVFSVNASLAAQDWACEGKSVRQSVNIYSNLLMMGYKKFATIDSEVIVRNYVFSVKIADGGGGPELS